MDHVAIGGVLRRDLTGAMALPSPGLRRGNGPADRLLPLANWSLALVGCRGSLSALASVVLAGASAQAPGCFWASFVTRRGNCERPWHLTGLRRRARQSAGRPALARRPRRQLRAVAKAATVQWYGQRTDKKAGINAAVSQHWKRAHNFPECCQPKTNWRRRPRITAPLTNLDFISGWRRD